MRFTKLIVLAMASAFALAGCATDQPSPSGSTGPEEAAPMAPPAPPPPPPPPPPPTSMAAPSSGAAKRTEDIVVTGSGSDRRESMTIEPRDETPKPLPQSGTLTAGDYDDVLNPGLYKAYLDKTLQGELGTKDLPFVDAADRIEVHVTDRLGKPAPFTTILLSAKDGNEMFPLRTGADGSVFLYPGFDALGDSITLQLTSADARETLSHTINLSREHKLSKITLSFGGDAAKVQKLDLLLTMDATGSMSDEMRYLQSELLAILDRVRDGQDTLDIRVALIVYRDVGDQYVVRDFDFTGDLDAFSETLAAQSATGGGDFPEAMQDAMTKGLAFDWRDDAVKVNMLVADAPPHDEDIAATWDSALYSRMEGIHIVPLAASGVDGTAEFLMRSMGQITGGRYLFLTDDSGVGNPHAEPSVDCYVVTRLDSLVERVLVDLITGQRVEPDGDEVIRIVGDYKSGVCKVEVAES